MYHSLIIGDRNTYDDFGLIPTTRLVINPPEPNLSYLEIPGGNGVIDLSETLTGMISYSNRTGNLEFLISGAKNWSELFSELMGYLHGRFMRVVLEDDSLYYYEGRLTLDTWKSNKNNSTITLSYNLAPFKYETTNAVDGYLVSKRNLSSGNAYYYADENTRVLEAIVDCENIENLDVKATINQITYQCKTGENILPVLQTDGEGSIRISGNGSVTVKYRRGRL